MMELQSYIEKQIAFSLAAFGSGDRTDGIIDHMRKELKEVRDCVDFEEPALPEWVDLIILALDGAWRTGATPHEIEQALEAKLAKNLSRKWPDWRKAAPGKAIEHDRSAE